MHDEEHRGCGHVRVEAPDGTDALLIAQAVVGTGWLLKAERVNSDETIEFGPHRALNELLDRFVALGAEIYDSMLRELSGHMDSLVKARGRPLFTTAQLRELAQIIRDHHTAIIIAGVGPEAVPAAEVKRLIAAGIVPKSALKIIDDAHSYGVLLAELGTLRSRDTAKKFSYDAFKKRLAKRPLPLTPGEHDAIEYAKHHCATYVTGLGNKLADDCTTIAIEADKKQRQQYQGVIREEVAASIERRGAWRQVASEIGHRTKDWARDLKRIAATEKQRAMQEAFANRLKEREGGDPRNILVAKIPAGDACDHCVRLHLTGGQGSKPRIFRLSDLQANGSNHGRRAAQWMATVGPVHPWCACELIHVPEGWGFDNDGNLVPNRLRKGWRFEHDLAKALSYANTTDETGVAVRVGDPEVVAIIQEVITRTPPMLFTKRAGVTLITTDVPGVNSHLVDHDLAYWTGNEIRLLQTLKPEKVKSVLEHELGHSLNVYLLHKFGSTKEVVKWHSDLDAIAKREGYVSEYAKTAPIECAAEVSRMYLYERAKLQRRYPKQFAFVHRSYRDLFGPKALDVLGLTDESDIDTMTFDEFYTRFERAANAHGFSRSDITGGARIYQLAGSNEGIAVLSGLHGEERAGPIAVLRWLETAPVGRLVPPGARVWLLPLFSRAAWDSHLRTPGGVNRNDIWGPGATNRSAASMEVEKSLRAFRPQTFLDLHEDSSDEKGEGYIFGYHEDEEYAPALANALQCSVEPWRFRDKSARGASETFVRMLGCMRTTTVETPQSLALADRVHFHIQALQWSAGALA